MLEAGDDPLFVSRRMLIFASEDVGNADPRALVVVERGRRGAAARGHAGGASIRSRRRASTWRRRPSRTRATSRGSARRSSSTQHGALPGAEEAPQRGDAAHARGGVREGLQVRARLRRTASSPGEAYLPDELAGERAVRADRPRPGGRGARAPRELRERSRRTCSGPDEAPGPGVPWVGYAGGRRPQNRLVLASQPRPGAQPTQPPKEIRAQPSAARAPSSSEAACASPLARAASMPEPSQVRASVGAPHRLEHLPAHQVHRYVVGGCAPELLEGRERLIRRARGCGTPSRGRTTTNGSALPAEVVFSRNSSRLVAAACSRRGHIARGPMRYDRRPCRRARHAAPKGPVRPRRAPVAERRPRSEPAAAAARPAGPGARRPEDVREDGGGGRRRPLEPEAPHRAGTWTCSPVEAALRAGATPPGSPVYGADGAHRWPRRRAAVTSRGDARRGDRRRLRRAAPRRLRRRRRSTGSCRRSTRGASSRRQRELKTALEGGAREAERTRARRSKTRSWRSPSACARRGGRRGEGVGVRRPTLDRAPQAEDCSARATASWPRAGRAQRAPRGGDRAPRQARGGARARAGGERAIATELASAQAALARAEAKLKTRRDRAPRGRSSAGAATRATP